MTAVTAINDKPHFDVHFYTIDLKARIRITAIGADGAVCSKAVAAGFAPAGYIYATETKAPMMGGYWIDPKAPELQGKPFTSTFIYGSYNGQIALVEPMVTQAFLASDPNLVEALPLPPAYAKTAYYPTRYSVHHNTVRHTVRHEVTIALEGMTWRVAPSKSGGAASARGSF